MRERQPTELTEEAVERAIDRAGRMEVFRMAKMLGWAPGSQPPLWVWAEIAAKVSQERNRCQSAHNLCQRRAGRLQMNRIGHQTLFIALPICAVVGLGVYMGWW